MERIQLSKNFYLDEFTVSQTAARHGIDIEVQEDSPIFANLKRLCTDVLQPIRDELGVVLISSGFRPPEVNRLIGGSQSSAHMFGRAADFRVAGLTPYEVAKHIAESVLPFDQVIHEFGRWVHVGIAQAHETPRYQAMTAYKNHQSFTAYSGGIKTMEELVG